MSVTWAVSAFIFPLAVFHRFPVNTRCVIGSFNHGPQTLGPQVAFKQTYAELWLSLPFVSCEATALEGRCLLLLRRHAGTKWQTAVLIRATHHFLNLKCILDIIFRPFSNSYRTHGLRSFILLLLWLKEMELNGKLLCRSLAKSEIGWETLESALFVFKIYVLSHWHPFFGVQ